MELLYCCEQSLRQAHRRPPPFFLAAAGLAAAPLEPLAAPEERGAEGAASAGRR